MTDLAKQFVAALADTLWKLAGRACIWPLVVLASMPSPLTAQTWADADTWRRVDTSYADGLERLGIPGAVLIVVHDGRVVHVRGYGVTDFTTMGETSPDQTVFGVSSISKVVTAIAVMQLVESGSVALDDAVSDHVPGVDVNGGFGAPVTIRHLLTHTAGFDDLTIGVSARSADEVRVLGEYLSDRMPPRVEPPGQVTNYSNHAYALAGHLVELRSGLSFSDYVARNIFVPLNMNRSSFAQPLPEALEGGRAEGYTSGGAEVVPRIFFNDAPASALFTTATDMARLMNALLSETSVLASESLDTLLARHFSNHPDLPGVALGLRERIDNGFRVLEHGGDWQDYSSQLLIAPELGLGLFSAFSTPDGIPLARDVWEMLLGSARSESDRPQSTGADVERYAGRYRQNRYSRNTVAKVRVLAGAVPEIVVEALDGELRILERQYYGRGSHLFERDETGSFVGFRENDVGRITHLFFGSVPFLAFERMAWYEGIVFHRILLAVFLLGFPAWLFADRRGQDPRSLRARRTGRALSIGSLLYLMVIGLLLGSADPWEFQYGVPSSLIPILAFSFLIPAIAALFTARVALSWRRRSRVDLPARYTTLIVLGWAFVLYLHYWRLLGLRY